MLNQNKKKVIACMSAKDAIDYSEVIKLKYPNKIIKTYSANTDDDIKEYDFKNIKTEWIDIDCLIYSPTVQAGCNFDLEHFDKIFGILSLGSCSQRNFYQMLAR